MENANEVVREQIKKSRVRQWEIARVLGKTDSDFSRMLRTELSEAMKAKILAAIARIRSEEGSL